MKTRLCSNRKLKQMLSQMIPASSLGKSQSLLETEDTHGHVHITFHTKTRRLQAFDLFDSKVHPANSLVYQRTKNNNNKDTAKEFVQNNQLLSSGQLNNVMLHACGSVSIY